MKQCRVILSVLLVCSMLSACSITSLIRMPTSPKDFSKEGMTLTLDDSFEEAVLDGFTVCYQNDEIAVLTLKEAFTTMDGLAEMTVEEYTDLILEANSSKNPKSVDIDGLKSFMYDYYNEEEKVEYTYQISTYKASDAFWLVQFACRKDTYEKNEADMRTYAKSVRFEDSAS